MGLFWTTRRLLPHKRGPINSGRDTAGVGINPIRQARRVCRQLTTENKELQS